MSDAEAIKARLIGSMNKPVADLEIRAPSQATRVLSPVWRLGRRVADVLYGRGLDTCAGEVDIEHFHPDRVTYQPSGWRYLSRVLRTRDLGANEVFVDFGAGKGRVLHRAARYPFERVIGVEISPRLTAIAKVNLARRRRRVRCKEIELVTADVVEFEIPDDMTVAYFYHPFAGETFRTVVDRIVESLDRNPRVVRLIYACPAMEDCILATGRFRLERRSPGGRRDAISRRVCMYVHEPATGEGSPHET